MAKRIIDIIIASTGLLLFGIPMFIVAFLIKWLMPGPVFFVQERIGRHGKAFRLYKFRTMTVAPEKAKGSFDAGDKSRITPFGSLLRKTKLDELPQLFNVIKGDMSLVGPRPEVRQWTEVYTEKWKIVHTVKPGITDNASILYRNEEEILAQANDPVKTYREVILPRKLDLYIEYVNSHNLLKDLLIIIKTFLFLFYKRSL